MEHPISWHSPSHCWLCQENSLFWSGKDHQNDPKSSKVMLHSGKHPYSRISLSRLNQVDIKLVMNKRDRVRPKVSYHWHWLAKTNLRIWIRRFCAHWWTKWLILGCRMVISTCFVLTLSLTHWLRFWTGVEFSDVFMTNAMRNGGLVPIMPALIDLAQPAPWWVLDSCFFKLVKWNSVIGSMNQILEPHFLNRSIH